MRAHLTAVHPVLMARDVPTSVGFYVALGFRVAFQDDAQAPRYAVVVRDAAELHLQWQDATQWAHAIDRPTYRFRVDDPDVLFAEFGASGALPAEGSARSSPWSSPGETPWGTREFHVLDPAGNGLQFYAPVGDARATP